MKNVIVMGGAGKIGSAIVDILEEKGYNVDILEKNPLCEKCPIPGIKYKFLHVAIPYTDKFVSSVQAAILTYSPEYVVIHSTVPVGTTRKISKNAVHSPVRGQHTDLKGCIMKFVKYVAGVDKKAGFVVAQHLRELGLRVEQWAKPEETELNKLLCLTRFLNDLAMYEKAFQLSKKFAVSAARFMQWTDSYNDGYDGTVFVRPYLSFPMGKVNGTCALPVPEMLQKQAQDDWIMKNIALFKKSGGVA